MKFLSPIPFGISSLEARLNRYASNVVTETLACFAHFGLLFEIGVVSQFGLISLQCLTLAFFDNFPMRVEQYVPDFHLARAIVQRFLHIVSSHSHFRHDI